MLAASFILAALAVTMQVQDVATTASPPAAVTPNITLDAAVNPDVGQVESDPAVLNLSSYEVFQSERRWADTPSN
ncbi:MAG: DUF5916 domain-containing protein [Gemmatimonadota bacterium]